MKRLRLLVVSHFVTAALVTAAVGIGIAGPALGQSQGGSTLDEVIARGSINLGVFVDEFPYGFTDEAGNFVGWQVDQGNDLASGLGVTPNYVPTSPADRIPNLLTGKIDVMIGIFTPTMQRAQNVAFTQPFLIDALAFAVPEGSAITSAADLEGKTIAVAKGTTQADMVSGLVPSAQIVQFDQPDTAILAAQQGQADAVFGTSLYLLTKMKQNPAVRMTFLPDVAIKEIQAWGLRRGDPDWRDYLNTFLYLRQFDGTTTAQFTKWFGTPPPYPLPDYTWY